MRTVIMVLVLVTGLMLLSPVLQAQEQSSMMDEDMQGMMSGMDMMGGGMGMMGGSGMGGGMGMMGGQGMCGSMSMMHGGMGPLQMLNLTAEQRTKINAIHDGLRKEHWALMGKIMDERAKLRDLFEAEKPDTKKIGPVFDTIFGLRKQMMLASIDAKNRVQEVLTKEQLDQLKQWHHSRWQGTGGGGVTPGAGPGHMHGGMMGK
jgi:Spy/CpxP family protein refolding chaperone